MTAVQADRYAANLTAVSIKHNISVPAPAEGEVVIAVEASSVNPVDIKVLDGSIKSLFPLSFPQTLGCDLVGTVVSTHERATRFKVGDRVWGDLGAGTTEGAWASFAVVPEVRVSLAPVHGDATNLATIPLVGKTMWQALEFAKGVLTPDRKAHNRSVTVITSGTGGTGTVGVQISKALGASHIITTAGDTVAAAEVRSLGADTVVDYRTTDVLASLPESSVDIVLDNHGSDPDAAVRVLRAGGVFVSLLHASPTKPKAGVAAHQLVCNSSRYDDLDALGSLLASGALRPVVQKEYPMEQVLDALRHGGEGIGKVALAGFVRAS